MRLPRYQLKPTAPGAWLLYTHGQPPIEGTAVYRYDSGIWVCEDHPQSGQGTQPCDHIITVQHHDLATHRGCGIH